MISAASKGPLLSVVVPFYNVEQYVLACLRSLQKQTLTDLEVILVDDGSQDGTYDLCRAFCETDDRFRIVRQDNAGLGPARNTGISHARGEFLTFVDSDDLVPARAYEQMVGSLRASGSDMACGDARRFNNQGIRESFVHREPFATERICTHVREFPPLALDRMAWNKVYRRQFWDRRGFEFPAIMYEDYPVTIRSHVEARAVDVLSAPVYYWREREGGELSITQRKWELRNLRDRATSAALVLDYLADRAPGLLPHVERHFLHIDVGAIAAAFRESPPGQRDELRAVADEILARVSPESRASMHPFERIQDHLLSNGRYTELVQLVDHRARHGMEARLRRTGRVRPRYQLQLPFLDQPDVVPQELYDVPPRAIALEAGVLDAEWASGQLQVDLALELTGLSLAGARVDLWLQRPWRGRQRKVSLDSEVFPLERAHLGPDPSGFRVRLDPAALGRPGSDPAPGFWTLMCRVRAEGVDRTAAVSAVEPSRARWMRFHELPGGAWARLDSRGDEVGLEIRPPGDEVWDCTVVEDALVLTGHYRGAFEPEPVLRCRVDDGSAAGSYVAAAERGADDRHRFAVRVPARDIVAHLHQDPFEEQASWLVRLEVDGSARPLAVGSGAGAAAVLLGSRRVLTRTSIHGNLILHEGYAHPLVTDAQWTDEHHLRLSGVHDRTAERPDVAVLRRYVTAADPVSVEVPLRWNGTRFDTEVDLRELMARADAVDTRGEARRPPRWDLLLPLGEELEPAQIETERLAAMAAPRRVGAQLVRLRADRSARFRLDLG